MIRAAFFSLTAAGLFAPMAQAQSAVPLTDELFTFAWVVTELEGQVEAPLITPATFYVFDLADGDVGGDTPCGNSWNAKIKIDLPQVSITDVEAFYSDECPAFRNTIALLEALEQVNSAQTSPEGLELLAEDGRRLLLLNAGG